jgi:hypothetical protein
MNNASSLFVLILLGSLLADAVAQVNPRPRPGQQPGSSFPTYNEPGNQYGSQQGQIISERVMQNLRMFERVRLSELLRLSYTQSELEVRSITLLASSIRGQAQIDLVNSRGQSLGSGIVRRQQSEIRIQLPARTRISELELSSSEEALLDTVTAEVESSYSPGPGPGQEVQPSPQSMLRLMVNQDVRGMGEIHLKQLVRQQMGLTLEGAEIERVVVEASPLMYGRAASVQVELNNRLVGPAKFLSPAQQRLPLQVNSMEEVRSLKLIVRGDARVEMVHIRIGQVRPIRGQGHGQGQGQSQRVIVSQEISSGRPLELGRLLPYESRLISRISLEARTSRQSSAEVALIAFGQIQGSTIVTSVPMRPMIQLIRPMSARELTLQSLSPVLIDSIEVDFDSFQSW